MRRRRSPRHRYAEEGARARAEESQCLNSLGYIYAEEKIDAAKAVTLLPPGRGSCPRNAAYLDSLGWAYFRQGNLMEARANFRRALDLAPGNKDIAAHIRLCMDALKDVTDPLTPRGRAKGPRPGTPECPPRSSGPPQIF